MPDPRPVVLSRGLIDARRALERGGIESAAIDARLLLAEAGGFTPEDFILRGDDVLSPETLEILEGYIRRRLSHEPVSRILGRREFWGLSFRVTSATLDPRPDSELLVEATIRALKDRPSARIADFGSGTGCLLLSVLHAMPAAIGLGIDRSPGAVDCARVNAQALGLEGRARFDVADWTDFVGTGTPFDWILCNPPYIPLGEKDMLDRDVRDFDPSSALFAGEEGLDCYRDLAKVMPGFLTEGGGAAIELGVGQSSQVIELFEKEGFSVEALLFDLQGIARCLVIKKLLSKKLYTS